MPDSVGRYQTEQNIRANRLHTVKAPTQGMGDTGDPDIVDGTEGSAE